MTSLKCNNCGTVRDASDNFCRNCGRQITVNLPAVTESNLPAPVKAIPPSLVGSVAVLAVGTGLEWLARRMASNAARAVGRALVSREPQSPPRKKSRNSEVDAVTIDEIVYIRQVHLRR
jgi:hypothetical protein